MQTNALVVTGAGKAFSAGGDFEFLNNRSNDTGMRNSVIMRSFYSKFLRIRDLPIPVIAAINGPAIGAGLCFALGADLRIASKSAKLGITFVGLGLHPGMGATYFLPRLVGPQVAARLCLTGEVVTGEEAAKLGLVVEAVEDTEVLPKSLALASRIAEQAPIAVRSCVRSLRMQHDEGLDRALWREADAQSYCYSGVDLKEGVQAVAEKRKPGFVQRENYHP
jgi:enoyl-CoA hydratase